MKKTLMAEAPGILKLMVAGCIEYQKAGSLGKPNEVIEETLEYRKKQDQIGLFMDECLEIKKGSKTYATPLYEIYEKWAKEKNYSPKTSHMFWKMLKLLVFSDRDNKGVWYETDLCRLV
jgi:putative DNA primase/helicase